jgi:hypothetical protein
MAQTPFIVTKLGRVSDLNRDFDLAFWKIQSPAQRMAAVWNLVVFHHKLQNALLMNSDSMIKGVRLDIIRVELSSLEMTELNRA